MKQQQSPTELLSAPARLWAGIVLAFGAALSGCTLSTQPVFDRDQDGVVAALDCDDADPAVGSRYTDQDGDGVGSGDARAGCDAAGAAFASVGGDCDDSNPQIAPGFEERCDGIDNNCSGSVDEGLLIQTYYPDQDDDGFGLSTGAKESCAPLEGYSLQGEDCDDSQPLAAPDLEESCDGIDNNCNDVIDENVEPLTWYVDADGDGWGESGTAFESCEPPELSAQKAGDCDDNTASRNPDADELCNTIDDNCNGAVDEDAIDQTVWHADLDGDGYGGNIQTLVACIQPVSYLPLGNDCNDNNALIYPGQSEHCDGVDEDCDGQLDDGAVDGQRYYRDLDGDGYGDPGAQLLACSRPAGFVDVSGDCDDDRDTINPSEVEVCNLFDDNCDGSLNEGLPDNSNDGIPDCSQVAVVVSFGFQKGSLDNLCGGISPVEAEVDAIQSALIPLGLEARVLYEEPDSVPDFYEDYLQYYPLIVYTNGGVSDPPDEYMVDALATAADNGQWQLFMGDDLGLMVSRYDSAHDGSPLGTMTFLNGTTYNGAPDIGAVRGTESHPILDGPYGVVGDFDYFDDMDWTTGINVGETVLMSLEDRENVAALAVENDGSRTVTLLPALYDTINSCPVSNSDGLEQIERLFQNSVYWLYGG